MPGAHLNVDGGSIANACVYARSGSYVSVATGGHVTLQRYGKFTAEDGTFVYLYSPWCIEPYAEPMQ